MKRTIQQSRKSLLVNIPQDISEDINLQKGQTLRIEQKEDYIIMIPVAAPRKNMQQGCKPHGNIRRSSQ
jgi:antitoxin component of MazEF toxin-antitoxin module